MLLVHFSCWISLLGVGCLPIIARRVPTWPMANAEEMNKNNTNLLAIKYDNIACQTFHYKLLIPTVLCPFSSVLTKIVKYSYPSRRRLRRRQTTSPATIQLCELIILTKSQIILTNWVTDNSNSCSISLLSNILVPSLRLISGNRSMKLVHGYLSCCVWDTCPRYASFDIWSSSATSLLIAKEFVMSLSSFLLRRHRFVA